MDSHPDERVLPRLSYFICATGRTGGTLLCELLRSSGCAGAPDEVFETRRFSAWSDQLGTPDFGDYVLAVRDQMTDQSGVFGAKIFVDTLARVADALRARLERKESSTVAVLERAFPNLRYVWLRRNDKLRQAISHVRAMQTNVWHLHARTGQGEAGLVFDAEAIAHWTRRFTHADAQWERFFASHEIQPFTVVYEDLSANPTGTARRVLDYLGVQLPPSVVLPTPRLQKMADDVTEAWVERYRDLRSVE